MLALLTTSCARAQTAPLAPATAATSTDNSPVTVERFNGAPGANWKIDNITGVAFTPSPQGLQWTTAGKGDAFARWDIGTAPFEMSWRVNIENGKVQSWRYPGIAVGISSAAPGQMDDKSVTLSWSAHLEGLAASIHGGDWFEPNRNTTGHPPPFSRMNDKELSPRDVLNAAGGGGHFTSLGWPAPDFGATQLRFDIKRDAENVLTFQVFRPDYKDGEKPWDERKWQMKPEVAAIPLDYVIIKVVHNPNDPLQKGELPPNAKADVSGTLSDFQAWKLAAAPPRVDAVMPAQAVLQKGAQVRVTGANFSAQSKASVGGKEAALKFVSDKEVSVTLPDGAAGTRQNLEITNPDGLFGAARVGVPYGRFIEAVEPREALPQGGDIVTLVGGGLEKTTVVTFGGKAATVVDASDPTRVKVKVPAGATGVAAVSAQTGDQKFAGQPLFGYAPHPYLSVTAQTLPDQKKKWDEKEFANYRKVLLQMADKIAPGGEQTEKSGTQGIAELTWPAAFSDDPKLKAKLISVIETEVDSLNHNEFNIMRGLDMANAYDVMFEQLSPELKTRMIAYLERVSTSYVTQVKNGNWWYAATANPSNTIAVGAEGGGMAGLALMYSTPIAKEAAGLAPVTVKKYYRALLNDGGLSEGTLYWNYGLTPQLVLGHALKNATGSDEGLLDTPGLRNNVDFVALEIDGKGELFTFNDTQPYLTGWAIAADLGSRFDQPLMKWMADHMAGEFAQPDDRGSGSTRGDVAPYAFLWRDRTPTPATFPGVPVAAKLPELNWGVLRSDGAYIPSLVAGIKGEGGFNTHHYQADAGSFILDARGEEFLLDPGYYQDKANNHSLPLVDGQGPKKGVKAPLGTPLEKGQWRVLSVDATAAYPKDSVVRVKRHFVMAGDEALIVLDDIAVAAGKPGQITAQYQAGFAATARGDKAIITGTKNRLALQTFGPKLDLKATGPQKWGKSWIFEKKNVQWYGINGTYASDAATPLVTVLMPTTLTGEAPAATVTRGGQQIVVKLPSGASATFRDGANGWEFVGG